MDRIVSQKGISGSANQTSWKLDVGYLFKNLVVNSLEVPNIPIADFSLIEYEVNGTVVISLTGAELDAINQRDGLPAFDGKELHFPFGLEGMKDQRMRELTYINTGVTSPVSGKVIASHTLRITWANNHNVDLWALVSDQTPDGPGLIRRFQRGSGASAVGSTEINNLTKGTAQFSFWRRVFTVASAGTVTYQQLYTPKQQLWGTQVPTGVAKALDALGGHTPGAFFSAVMDFSALNGGYNALAKTDSHGAVQADTPDVPFLPTLALKDDTLTLATWNSAAGTNGLLLEAVGEID
jgi:Viral coat protein P2 N-terminal domain